MNCADFERLIALDVEGDLPGPKSRAVAEHLLACPSCRQFAEQVKFSQALLKNLGQEPADERMLQEVRRRVQIGLASETQPQGFPVWQFALGVGLITALIFAVITLRPHSGGANTQFLAEGSRPANAARPNKDETRNSKIDARSAKPPRVAKDLSANPRGRVRSTVILPASSAAGTPKSAQAVPSKKLSSGSMSASANAQHPQPLTIKLLTDNPNVVIYWLVD
jgi:anti-sigma factor RsiW